MRHRPACDANDLRYLRAGPLGAFVTVALLHDHTYELNLTVEDEYGNVASDALVVTSDVELPTLVTNLTADVFQRAAGLLSWTAQDPVSGLSDVHTERFNASSNGWEPWGASMSAPVGTKTPVALSVTLSAEDLAVDGNVVRLRVVAEDRAGNMNVTEHNVTVDLTPPSVVEEILGAVNGILSLSLLNTTVQATDAGSGLASLRVEVKNLTDATSVVLYDNESMNGSATIGPLLSSTAPVLDAQYRLEVVAEDRAGHVTSSTSTVTFHPPPVLNLNVPELAFQYAGYLKIRGNASVEGFSGEAVDYAWIRVINPNGSTILNTNVTGVDGVTILAANWSAVNLSAGVYVVRLDAFRAGVGINKTADVEVVPKTGTYTDLATDEASLRYDLLPAGSSQHHLYKLEIPVCYSGFRLKLDAIEGSAVDLKIQEKAPTNLAVNAALDPGWEDVSEDHHESGQLPGDVFSVLVQHGAAESFYKLLFEPEDYVC